MAHTLRAGVNLKLDCTTEGEIKENQALLQSGKLLDVALKITTPRQICWPLKFGGETYDSMGVRFKGQTLMAWEVEPEKSFNITMDFVRDGQQLEGYKTLNLNNSFEDASFMREVFTTIC